MSQLPLPFGSQMTFFLSVEGPCPYLEGLAERKLFTRYTGDAAADREMSDVLTRAGFRRSHDVLYRQACTHCTACLPVRLVVGEFFPSRRHRRVEKCNVDLEASFAAPAATDERFELFQNYVWARHGESDMARMDWDAFTRMLELGTADTKLLELRGKEEGRLFGCMLVDEVEDGFSAVYSFFDPRESRRSLGTALILALARESERKGKPHLYLGYWIKACAKMAYKSRFKPLEMLTRTGWKRL